MQGGSPLGPRHTQSHWGRRRCWHPVLAKLWGDKTQGCVVCGARTMWGYLISGKVCVRRGPALVLLRVSLESLPTDGRPMGELTKPLL